MKCRSMIICVVVLTLLLSITSPAFASERSANATVGTLTLWAAEGGSSSGGIWNLGHAFLSFKNTSGSVKYFGVYPVANNEEVTVGTFSTNSGHNGIWYNMESYLYHEKGNRLIDRVSLTISITQNQLDEINSIINDSGNDYYNITTYNCVDFALLVWYEVNPYYVFSTGNPSSPHVLFDAIVTTNEHQVDKAIVDNQNVGYADNGVFMEVTEKALEGITRFLEVDDSETM